MLAVSTGVDSFVKPEDIGPLYPFVGAETVLFAVALFLWLAWHFLQARGETREHRDACALYDQIGLDRALHYGGSALLPTDEEWERSPHRTGLLDSRLARDPTVEPPFPDPPR